MADKDDAKKLVDDFAARTSGGGLWLSITRADLAAGLKERIDDPNKIDQGNCSLCGPADYMWDLASDFPKVYARAGIELWETGSTLIGTLKVKPCSDLMRHALPATARINAADWVTLASIRDSDNWILDYESESDDAAGITMPHSIASWMRATGYTKVENETNVYLCKDLPNARAASRLRGDGYRVYLFINANMLYPDKQDNSSIFSTPDHWVVLLDTMNITVAPNDANSTISLTVFTWGERRNVPQTGTLKLKSFLNNYYGYVACKL